MGQLRPKPAKGNAAASIVLPAPKKQGGLPLMEALASRRSSRDFASGALPLPLLSGLLWAAYGVNRPDGGRTAPSAELSRRGFMQPSEQHVGSRVGTGQGHTQPAEQRAKKRVEDAGVGKGQAEGRVQSGIARRLLRPSHPMQPGQFDLKHLPIEKQDRRLRLILRRRHHLALHRQVRQKRLDLLRAHSVGMALVMKSNKAQNPIDIGLPGAQGIMQHPQTAPDLIHEPGRSSIRRSGRHGQTLLEGNDGSQREVYLPEFSGGFGFPVH